MSYEICIRVDDDRKLSVGVDKGEEAAAPGEGGQGAMSMGDEGGEMQYQPVGSIKEALMAAMEIYQNDGEMGAGEDEFNAGYGSKKQGPPPIREASDEEGM